MRGWLKAIREDANMTQENVSLKSGISREYYNRIESGRRGNKLPVSTAKRIAEALNFNWQLFYEKGERIEE